MASSTPATATSGGVATAAMWNAGVRDNFAALADWTSYTPTLTQPGTITKTVTYAKYRKYGTTCHVVVFLTVTGTGTTANNIIVGLPSGATASTATALAVGAGSISDTGTSEYPVVSMINSTTSVKFLKAYEPSGGSFVGVDPGFALANTDLIRFEIEYETT